MAQTFATLSDVATDAYFWHAFASRHSGEPHWVVVVENENTRSKNENEPALHDVIFQHCRQTKRKTSYAYRRAAGDDGRVADRFGQRLGLIAAAHVAVARRIAQTPV
jgi:hypothetical protein